MTIVKLVTAAGLACTALTAVAPAMAQEVRHDRREVRDDRRDLRQDRRELRRDIHRRAVYRYHHRHCWTSWRYHRRVTVCR
jgi:hypothetical protein